MRIVRHTGWMVVRQARNLMREPIWIAMMVIQPRVARRLDAPVHRVEAREHVDPVRHRLPREQDRRDEHQRGASGIYLLLLLAATGVTSLFATWCFRSYQRSI